MFNQKKSEKIQRNSKEIEIMILLSYLVIFLTNFWVYHFFQVYYVLVIPEASHAFKWMFFDALVIQEPSQIDPGSIWEKSFFHENFQNFEPYDEVEFLENSYVYP